MTISLLHPSRGRATKAYNTYRTWIKHCADPSKVEHILSLDADDREVSQYKSAFNGSKILVNDNSCVVQATNHAASASGGGVLIYLSDDFNCIHNWDTLILKEIQQNTPQLIKVDDCLQKFESDVLTIPIMNRALYVKLGYFWNPLYKSMFVDQDLYHVCRINGWLKLCPHLRFPHEHHVNGKAANDETYKRSSSNWDQGKAMYAQRRKENFKL